MQRRYFVRQKEIRIEEVEGVIAVRADPAAHIDLRRQLEVMRATPPVDNVDAAALKPFERANWRFVTRNETTRSALETHRAMAGGDTIGRLFRRDNGALAIGTNRLTVQLDAQLGKDQCRAALSEKGLELVRKLGFGKNLYEVRRAHTATASMPPSAAGRSPLRAGRAGVPGAHRSPGGYRRSALRRAVAVGQHRSGRRHGRRRHPGGGGPGDHTRGRHPRGRDRQRLRRRARGPRRRPSARCRALLPRERRSDFTQGVAGMPGDATTARSAPAWSAPGRATDGRCRARRRRRADAGGLPRRPGRHADHPGAGGRVRATPVHGGARRRPGDGRRHHRVQPRSQRRRLGPHRQRCDLAIELAASRRPRRARMRHLLGEQQRHQRRHRSGRGGVASRRDRRRSARPTRTWRTTPRAAPKSRYSRRAWTCVGTTRQRRIRRRAPAPASPLPARPAARRWRWRWARA